jgi:protease IV
VKNFQKIFIVGILLLPVILGAFISGLDSTPEASFSGSALKRIGLVRVDGVIMDGEEVIRQLRSFRNDNTIAGVLLKVNSPGGAVAPSQEIYAEVLNYQKQNKPLIVSMGTVAASGGYYISSPAKKIFADPGTLTGSIGVIMTLPMYEALAKKVGVEMRTFKAGKFKDLTSPYRSMAAPEQALLQGMLDDTHDQFIGDVATARNLPYDTIKVYADGRVFTGRQALKAHLVDSLGGYHDALKYLRHITGLSDKAKIIERTEKSTLFREWLVEEAIKVFPGLYLITSKPGPQFLLN